MILVVMPQVKLISTVAVMPNAMSFEAPEDTNSEEWVLPGLHHLVSLESTWGVSHIGLHGPLIKEHSFVSCHPSTFTLVSSQTLLVCN